MVKKIKKEQVDKDNEKTKIFASEIISSLTKNQKYENGRALVGISMSYIEMLNEINAAYIERLKTMVRNFDELERVEKEIDHQEKLEKVRKDLNN